MVSPGMMALPVALVVLSGCAGVSGREAVTASTPPPTARTIPSSADSVPAEFKAACGRPGAEVITHRLHVVIKHAECDLAGVVIINQGRGVTVPMDPGGVGSSSGVSVQVARGTEDVSFTAEAGG